MNQLEKYVLLVRMNVAWSLSEKRPIDVEDVDTQTWNISYQHCRIGQISSCQVCKSELDRAEWNMYSGRFRVVLHPLCESDGVVLVPRKQLPKRKMR